MRCVKVPVISADSDDAGVGYHRAFAALTLAVRVITIL